MLYANAASIGGKVELSCGYGGHSPQAKRLQGTYQVFVFLVNQPAYNNVADVTRLTNRFGAKPHTVAHLAFATRGTDKSAVGNTTFHIVLWRQRTNGNAIIVK